MENNIATHKLGYAELCECQRWCRVNEQPITDKHHEKCPHYNDEIRVVKITYEGQSFFDSNIEGALSALADGDDYKYEIELMRMKEREYLALPEFAGF